MPGYLYTYRKFREKFEIPIVREQDKKTLERLNKLVSPFILRRLKNEVLKELPEKTETTMYASMDGEQKKLYLANLAKAGRIWPASWMEAILNAGSLLFWQC